MAVFAKITQNECIIRNRPHMSCYKYSNITNSVLFSNSTASLIIQTTTSQLIANNISGCFFLKHGVQR